MPINTREILNAVSQLTADRNVKVAVRESLKGGCITGGAAVLGGLLLGPPGLALGGIVGGCTAAAMSNNKFKSVPRVIAEDMTSAQRDSLARSVYNVLQNLRIEDATVLLPLLLNDPVAKAAVLRAVFMYFQQEMNLSIVD
ncbi:hypothetical protein L9F63_021406 [Diploptera punctata]|uniref:Uncharacterized protein n=1 Tax=Diploptera punctata TaxID=6984 RepID=A0AAD7ZNY3_DIPPU|nr:hypothetical protein L9F63_021406 [Diploptera punctata]